MSWLVSSLPLHGLFFFSLKPPTQILCLPMPHCLPRASHTGFSKWVKLWVPGILFLFPFTSSTCACSESCVLAAWVVSLYIEYVELLEAEKFSVLPIYSCYMDFIYFILWVIFQYLFCCSDFSSFDHWELFLLFLWSLYMLPFLSLFSLLFQLKGPRSNGTSVAMSIPNIYILVFNMCILTHARAYLVAQRVKNLPAMQETQV